MPPTTCSRAHCCFRCGTTTTSADAGCGPAGLQVDIAFGDAVTPAPETVSYPVLLEDLPAPQLRSYPKYTVVAEKFHAVCLLGMANTRMKDYFDLWVLLAEDALEAAELRRALEATFDRRKLAIPSTLPSGLSDAFVQDAAKQRQWAAFLKKNRLEALDLAEVVALLRGEFQNSGPSELHGLRERWWWNDPVRDCR